MSKRRQGSRANVDPSNQTRSFAEAISRLEEIPATYQDIINFVAAFKKGVDLFTLRYDTISRIQKITLRPLVCYVAKTLNAPQEFPTGIDDGDLVGFSDLIKAVPGDEIDVFVVSNGGYPDATERIVRLLRERFRHVRFIVPANAYSAATLLCFSGDCIMMSKMGSLGPIDPQMFGGIPARAIQRGFETVKKRLEKEGPDALTAYMPLLLKYDLHLLEMCESAQKLSKELARMFLKTYMLKESDRAVVRKIVDFFSNYDRHKSHSRSIDRDTAKRLGLVISDAEAVTSDAEATQGLGDLVSSLYNQYELWFDQTPFFKMYENTYGVNWGRKAEVRAVQIPMSAQQPPQRGTPQRTG